MLRLRSAFAVATLRRAVHTQGRLVVCSPASTSPSTLPSPSPSIVSARLPLPLSLQVVSHVNYNLETSRETAVRCVPLSTLELARLAFDDAPDSNSNAYELTSVRRKRVLKMSKHKLKKRRRKMKALMRRLGKI